MTITCIAIDDEPPALKLLTMLIGQTDFLTLKGAFNNGIEALRYLSENHVDLVFLDIQMPDMTGIAFARLLNKQAGNPVTNIIFTTAFDQFAIEGYRLNVLDYLLKPYTYEDFLRATKKVLLIKSNNITTAVPAEEAFVYVKVGFQIRKVICNHILYIEGFKDYAKIYLDDADAPVLAMVTLKLLEERLPQNHFMRVHKSFIVSVKKITTITKNSINIGDKLIPVSEKYKEAFMNLFDSWT